MKRNHKNLPDTVERKPDTLKANDKGELQTFIGIQHEWEKQLYPMRITPTTVIYVTKNKQTREYAERYRREKMGGK